MSEQINLHPETMFEIQAAIWACHFMWHRHGFKPPKDGEQRLRPEIGFVHQHQSVRFEITEPLLAAAVANHIFGAMLDTGRTESDVVATAWAIFTDHKADMLDTMLDEMAVLAGQLPERQVEW